jgi:Uma2 family endonuclease
MLTTRPRPATYADLEALPPNVVGEIVHGALHAHPRPAPRHGIAANRLGTEITGPFDFGRGGPGGWIFMVEPELHLGPHVVVPDLAGWRRERLTPFPTTAYIEAPPDWLAEVLSPSTEALDRGPKLAIYGEYRVGHCWFVDPVAKTLEAYALDGTTLRRAHTFRDAEPVTAPPFDVHTFPLDTLWAGL